MMQVIEEDKVDKVAAMKKTYNDLKLDCLLCLAATAPTRPPTSCPRRG